MSLRRFRRLVVAAGCLALLPSVAQAAMHQSTLTRAGSNSAVEDGTPEVVSKAQDARCMQAQPSVDAIAVLGDMGFMGGPFDCVKQGSTTLTGQPGLASFSISGRDLRPGFVPPALTLNAAGVRALVADPSTNSLFVGGDFKYTVPGTTTTRNGLVKLNATTGAIDTSFKPAFGNGMVSDLELVTLAGQKRLLVGGAGSVKLASLSPTTGANDKFVDALIEQPIIDSDGFQAWGAVGVYQMAVRPGGTQLALTGNFMKVDGQARRGFVVLSLADAAPPAGSSGDTVHPWYYSGFAKDCGATGALQTRRIAYLQGVDWSPGGEFLTVTATGRIPEQTWQVFKPWMTDAQKAQTTVCDAVGRFAFADSSKPVWVNYTGGDSVWTVQDTGSAVYVQGHFKWLDDPDGFGSMPARWEGTNCKQDATTPKDAGVGCVGVGVRTDPPAGTDPRTGVAYKEWKYASFRTGLGAIDPHTGLAIDSWTVNLNGVRKGGKALLVTEDGLWAGTDAPRVFSESHYGLAYLRWAP
ncbi:MAG: hypothetical protein AVDCRST_MAG34-190 [uncultured Nocardioidaceae bacterium]|uniref:Uncharacterized protein n=1 Tax=uncultured Nocardioidaceae bacterium TaxID=253824 RepID=A0A6J4LIN8_9ACTN|nr:MAG: hypothetical protein AVDCRST_MAG34-190 [uncultured Nocardioidaceae bacterium]